MIEARKYYAIKRHGSKWMVFDRQTGFDISLEPNFIEALRTVKIRYHVINDPKSFYTKWIRKVKAVHHL